MGVKYWRDGINKTSDYNRLSVLCDLPSINMFKFFILSVISIARGIVAQEYVNYQKCIGLNHGTQVGVGHEISCTKYYFCSQGIGILEDCTEIYGDTRVAFNLETKLCGYNIACKRPIITTTTTTTTTTEAPEVVISGRSNSELDEIAKCPTANRPGEIFLLPSQNCSQFFICSNGARMLMSCIKGLLWNEDMSQCDYPTFSRCASRQVPSTIRF